MMTNIPTPKIKYTPPPQKIYKQAQKQFGKDNVDFKMGTVFTVNDTIYTKGKLSDDLYIHEITHIIQQTKMGWRKWWKKYFKDEQFRYEQELEAYRNQYRWVKNNIKDRNKQNDYLIFFAKMLSGKMYGGIKSFGEAKHEICGN